MKAFGLSYCPLAVLHAERERTVDGEAATDEAVRRQSATEQEAVGSSVEMQDESAGQLRPWRHEDATEQAEVTGQPGGIGHPLTMEHPEAMAHQGATGYPEATNEQMSTRTEAVEQQEPASVPQQAADLGDVTAGGAAADAAGANAVHQEATEQEKPVRHQEAGFQGAAVEEISRAHAQTERTANRQISGVQTPRRRRRTYTHGGSRVTFEQAPG
ncbi:hypothetical protein MPH_10606 [Macrophomina phaseolina MS6]|uniref:Uncharacterized protein n=1 Tax=Macrophomina phaseolina (strain MS6) TaxID=1126212 RepID=K2QQV7_MACPH|nr:hypothetical protein MPH_10606 [Macrophomina phaseolina MS6]